MVKKKKRVVEENLKRLVNSSNKLRSRIKGFFFKKKKKIKKDVELLQSLTKPYFSESKISQSSSYSSDLNVMAQGSTKKRVKQKIGTIKKG